MREFEGMHFDTTVDAWLFGAGRSENVAQSRSCGECSACCTTCEVSDMEPPKPVGVKCRHVCASGCAIQASKPPSCAAFLCDWRVANSAFDRPDKSGVMVWLGGYSSDQSVDTPYSVHIDVDTSMLTSRSAVALALIFSSRAIVRPPSPTIWVKVDSAPFSFAFMAGESEPRLAADYIGDESIEDHRRRSISYQSMAKLKMKTIAKLAWPVGATVESKTESFSAAVTALETYMPAIFRSSASTPPPESLKRR